MAGKFKFMGYKFTVDPQDSPGPFRPAGPIKDKAGKVVKDADGKPKMYRGDLVWVNIYGAKGHFAGSTKAGGYVKRASDAELSIELGGQLLAFQLKKDFETGAELWMHIISQGKATD